MEDSYMTALRVFLIVGGLAFIVYGIQVGTIVHFGLGIVAATLGAYRLWDERWRHKETAEAD